jgi:geranylgeranyl diphosphate synthase type II
MNDTENLDLEALLRDTFERFQIQKDGSTPLNLSDSISYSLLSPGKRIRPRILLACGAMIGLPVAELVPAAMALEMVHCFTLIHDDLPCMDDDDFRRGMLSNHKKFGEAIALLAGDGLMALAVDVFLESPVAPQLMVQGLKRMAWAMGPRGVIGGQAAESLLNAKSTLEDLKAMHRQKTGALFSAAILIPKDFANLSDDSTQGRALRTYADSIGFAFQIADDLEDGLSGQDGERDSTNILTYMTQEEAQRLIQESLTEASLGLNQHWGDKSQTLVEIANEVIRKSKVANP